jgi:hypothetical protein
VESDLEGRNTAGLKAAITTKAEEEVFEFANLFLGSRKATNPLLVLLRPPPLDIEGGGRGH